MKTILTGAFLLFIHFCSLAQFNQGAKLLSFDASGNWSHENTTSQISTNTISQRGTVSFGVVNSNQVSRGLFLGFSTNNHFYESKESEQINESYSGQLGYFRTRYNKISADFFWSMGYTASYELTYTKYSFEYLTTQSIPKREENFYTHGLNGSLQLGLGYFIKPYMAINAGYSPLYLRLEYGSSPEKKKYSVVHSVFSSNIFVGLLFVL